jgi:hypothetical protein
VLTRFATFASVSKSTTSISALTGISLDTAEMLVVTPQGGGQFVVNGRCLCGRSSYVPADGWNRG